MAFRVLLVGGGSGGHIYPLIAVARALKKQNPSVDLRIMGDGPYVGRAAKEAGISYTNIIAPKLRRYASMGNVLDVLKIPFALVQSLFKVWWYMPDVLFAKGGYACAFPTFVARLYRIPVYLHETDSVPGLANRILAKRAKLVFTSFPAADQTFGKLGITTLLTGNPFRSEVAGVERTAAHVALKLDPNKKTVLVIGGSQGAKQLNDLVLDALVQMVQKGWNIIHQTGERNFDEVKKAVELYMAEGKDSYAPLIAAQYRVYSFFDEGQLATAYGACDVAVTRAGGSLTELAYLGKPMIIVPLLGSANDHQQENASELEKFGALVAEGENVVPSIIMRDIEKLLDPQTASQISVRIRQFAHADAADRIATTLLS